MKFLLRCIVLYLIVSGSMAVAQKAGKGEYDPILVPATAAGENDRPLSIGEDYIRIEESTWYVNAQDNLLTSRMVSGTVDVQIGTEHYQSVLPLYELKGGAKTAPLFNRTILYNRVYNGGDMKMNVYMAGIKKDTVLGELVKGLAATAVDIGISKVGTATSLGTFPPLAAASQQLSSGVQELLKTGEKHYGIFSANNGLEFTFPNGLTGRQYFLLAYRGNPLDKTKISVADSGNGTFSVTHNNQPITGGAWVLFRISREVAYKGDRPWRQKSTNIKNSLNELMQDWRVGAKTQSEVQKALTATVVGDAIADRLLAIRSEINADSVLTVSERARYSGELVSLLLIAQQAAKSATADLGMTDFIRNRDKLHASMLTGTRPDSETVASAFKTQFKSAVEADEAAFVGVFKSNFAVAQPILGEKLSQIKSFVGIRQLATDAVLQRLTSSQRDTIVKASQIKTSDLPTDEALWRHFGRIEAERQTDLTK